MGSEPELYDHRHLIDPKLSSRPLYLIDTGQATLRWNYAYTTEGDIFTNTHGLCPQRLTNSIVFRRRRLAVTAPLLISTVSISRHCFDRCYRAQPRPADLALMAAMHENVPILWLHSLSMMGTRTKFNASLLLIDDV